MNMEQLITRVLDAVQSELAADAAREHAYVENRLAAFRTEICRPDTYEIQQQAIKESA